MTTQVSLASGRSAARVGASPAAGTPAPAAGGVAAVLMGAVAAVSTPAAVALSVALRRERTQVRYWRAVAELEFGREAGLFEAYDVTAPARGRSFTDFAALVARRLNRSRAGAVTPPRVSL